ncbi:MAG TPA: 4Fe-4S cluster-binding domain-containing protein [Gallicola sp.]|nr:4Fe-4S cluster-binding domain-containing protein [Gallicola sp.]
MNYYGKREGVLASTNGIAFEIYVVGCEGYCKGCHSPHLWDKNQGVLMDEEFYNSLISYMKEKEWQFDNIVLLGGEPLDNPKKKILEFVEKMKIFNKPLWLYTHFELNEIDEDIKQSFDYIKTGKYNENLRNDNYISRGVGLISTNQKINKRGEDY